MQPDFFSYLPTDYVGQNPDMFTKEFKEWLPENMHVWDAFVREAFKIIERGHTHYSSVTIIEFLRHHTSLQEKGKDWKLNNNMRPYLSRLFALMYPKHKDLFEFRKITKPAKEKMNGE